MSRSALWRQEANIKERERQASESFQRAYDEGKARNVKGAISLVGGNTFNLNPMLLQNISKSQYFIKCCNNLHDWSSLVDEIYYEVQHMEPFLGKKFRRNIFLSLSDKFQISSIASSFGNRSAGMFSLKSRQCAIKV